MRPGAGLALAALMVSAVVSAVGPDALRARPDAAQAEAAPTSGIEVSSLDTSVRPQDDLYRYVNGGWLDRTPMPPDRVTYGALIELTEKAESDLRAIVEEAARSRHRSGPAQQVGDLYASAMDEARIEALGITPIQPELKKIEAIRNASGIAAEAGYLSAIGAGGPFAGAVGSDPEHPGARIARISQGGTLLPDRDYYLGTDAASIAIRAQYQAYLALIFTLVGRPNAAADARAVVALETALATAQWSQVDSRDPHKIANRFELARLRDEMPGFDWRAWAQPQGLDRASYVVLAQPSFFRTFAALVPETPLDTWKAWLVGRYVTAVSIYLTKALVDARFEFFGRVLTGQQQPRARWKMGTSMCSGYLGDAVGRLYVERHFSAKARARVEKLAANIVSAYRVAIADARWMTPATKRQALDKLSKLSMKVGYPERWRDYSSLEIRRDDYFGNWRRAVEFDNAYRMGRESEAADRREWLMTPQTVNAYYSPANNEIVLPAAILQPPLFTMEADDAVNYGGIGAVVGHEIGHGFDANGRVYDGNGAVRDWWTAADDLEYRKIGARLAAQFNAYSPLPGMHVNGELTMAENIGDLGGLAIAFKAYQLSLGGKPAPVIDGFTGEQRFFMGWARVWRSKTRDEYMRGWLLSTPHAPGQFRANGVVSNMPGFYDAFGVTPQDRLFRAPEQRIRIW